MRVRISKSTSVKRIKNCFERPNFWRRLFCLPKHPSYLVTLVYLFKRRMVVSVAEVTFGTFNVQAKLAIKLDLNGFNKMASLDYADFAWRRYVMFCVCNIIHILIYYFNFWLNYAQKLKQKYRLDVVMQKFTFNLLLGSFHNDLLALAIPKNG